MKEAGFIVPNMILALAALSLAGGCTVGGNIAKSDFAISPKGDNVEILLNDNRNLAGEFLTLWEETIIVLVSKDGGSVIQQINQDLQFPVLVSIPFEISRTITLQFKDRKIVNRGKPSSKENLENYRLYSRYPQGISPQVMKELLEAYNQKSLLELTLKETSFP